MLTIYVAAELVVLQPPPPEGPQCSRASDTALPWPLGSPEMSCGSPAAPHTESPVPVLPFQRLLSRLWSQGSRRFLGCHGEVPSCLGSGWPRVAYSLQAEEHPQSPPPAREERNAAASGRRSDGSHAKLFKPQCRWGWGVTLWTPWLIRSFAPWPIRFWLPQPSWCPVPGPSQALGFLMLPREMGCPGVPDPFWAFQPSGLPVDSIGYQLELSRRGWATSSGSLRF